MHKFVRIIEAVNKGSDALIRCLVWVFTTRFLVMNAARKINGSSMTNIFSVMLSGSKYLSSRGIFYANPW
jgi:hypothetical protein